MSRASNLINRSSLSTLCKSTLKKLEHFSAHIFPAPWHMSTLAIAYILNTNFGLGPCYTQNTTTLEVMYRNMRTAPAERALPNVRKRLRQSTDRNLPNSSESVPESGGTEVHEPSRMETIDDRRSIDTKNQLDAFYRKIR